MIHTTTSIRSGLLLALTTLQFHSAADAQTLSHVVLPNGTAAADANGSNTLPWGRATLGAARVQMLYDTSHFTAQGITQPIRIMNLRWRANGAAASWTGGLYQLINVSMSSSPRDANSPSNTWLTNQGANNTVVYSGGVAFLAGSATAGAVGPTVVDLNLMTPFVYDPSLGQDLLIDVDMPAGQWQGGTAVATDALTTAPGTGRISATNAAYGGNTGTVTQQAQALVVDIGYQPVNGVVADFTASVTSGPSPLAVTFTDTSFTSDPAGITQWAWDFNGDGLIDSTLRNPTFTYSQCGEFSVTLHATSPSGTATKTVQNMIVTDVFTPNFSVQQLSPGTIQFTDTSSPVGTAWAWDFDGDQVVDSTAGPTVVHTYPTTCVAQMATLSVSRNCRGPFTVSHTIAVSPGQLGTTTQGGTIVANTGFFWPGVLFDVTVTNPQGISICAVSLPLRAPSGFVDMDFYVTAGSYVGKQTQPHLWGLASYGYGPVQTTTTNGVTLSSVPLSTPLYLAPGNYGFSFWVNDFVGNNVELITTTGGTQTYSNADLIINPNPTAAPGMTLDDWFTGTPNANQAANVMLHYSQLGTTGEAGLGYFAHGCGGSMIPGRIFAPGLPKLGGTLNLEFWDLPYDLAFAMIGFSRTTSPLGPLPIDLGAVGAPGCFAHVSPDMTNIVFGSFTIGNWTMPVPNLPTLLGSQFFSQCFPYDPGINAFDFVASNAVAGIVGN